MRSDVQTANANEACREERMTNERIVGQSEGKSLVELLCKNRGKFGEVINGGRIC